MCTQAEPYGSEPHSEKQIADAFAGDVFGTRGYWGHHSCSLSLHSFLDLIGADLHRWIPVGALSSCGLFGKAGLDE